MILSISAETAGAEPISKCRPSGNGPGYPCPITVDGEKLHPPEGKSRHLDPRQPYRSGPRPPRTGGAGCAPSQAFRGAGPGHHQHAMTERLTSSPVCGTVVNMDSGCCPRCACELNGGGTDGERTCESCGGTFLSVRTLRALIEAAQASPTTGAYERPQLHLDAAVRYLSCPVCASPMVMQNFGNSSGVIVDVCAAHGLWFDAGELTQVMSFAASGALADANAASAERQRARRELDRFFRRLEAAGPSRVSGVPSF